MSRDGELRTGASSIGARAAKFRNADLPQGRRLEFRIGVNLGDVIAEDEDLLGDRVLEPDPAA
jgi:class 3 adenylate cyclase